MNENKNYPSIAVIGRPNVGKSTLFNRLLGRRQALVHEEPGTTRDRNETLVSWNRRKFRLVDTGGWAHDVSIFSTPVRKQMEAALRAADLALLVVDGKSGLHPLDAELADLVRKSGKQSILVVNKIDNGKDENKTADFYRLGMDEMIGISASHGRNIAELLELLLQRLPEMESAGPETPAIHLILVGKPNVGKSSLLNALSRKERSIVHSEPGTTREAIDTDLEFEGQRFVLIDTPGLHRKHRFSNDMEYLMSLSTHHAVERADVAVLVIDASQGIGETETKIAEMIQQNHKACLIAVNKWDLIENREEAVGIFRQQLEQKLQFLWWAKVVFVSAKSGQRLERILSEAISAYDRYVSVLPEVELRETVRDAETRKPLSRRGEILRIRAVRQVDTRPPVIHFSVNDTKLVHFSYRRYLENSLRGRFDLTGTPIILKFARHKPEKIRYE